MHRCWFLCSQIFCCMAAAILLFCFHWWYRYPWKSWECSKNCPTGKQCYAKYTRRELFCFYQSHLFILFGFLRSSAAIVLLFSFFLKTFFPICVLLCKILTDLSSVSNIPETQHFTAAVFEDGNFPCRRCCAHCRTFVPACRRNVHYDCSVQSSAWTQAYILCCKSRHQEPPPDAKNFPAPVISQYQSDSSPRSELEPITHTGDISQAAGTWLRVFACSGAFVITILASYFERFERWLEPLLLW